MSDSSSSFLNSLLIFLENCLIVSLLLLRLAICYGKPCIKTLRFLLVGSLLKNLYFSETKNFSKIQIVKGSYDGDNENILGNAASGRCDLFSGFFDYVHAS